MARICPGCGFVKPRGDLSDAHTGQYEKESWIYSRYSIRFLCSDSMRLCESSVQAYGAEFYSGPTRHFTNQRVVEDNGPIRGEIETADIDYRVRRLLRRCIPRLLFVFSSVWCACGLMAVATRLVLLMLRASRRQTAQLRVLSHQLMPLSVVSGHKLRHLRTRPKNAKGMGTTRG